MLYICASEAAAVCQQKSIRQMIGYRCNVIDSDMYIQIPNIGTQRCTYECMRRVGCMATCYTASTATCLVAQDEGAGVVEDPAFEMAYFGNPVIGECRLSWAQLDGYDSAMAVTSKYCFNDPANPKCHVGGLIDGPGVFPTSYAPAKGNELATVLVGDEHTDGLAEILQVSPECTVLWVAFMLLVISPECTVLWVAFDAISDPLPSGSVKGGSMLGATDLYILRAKTSDGYTLFGYYYPTSKQGYIYHYSVDQALTYTQMEIMVQIWLIHWSSKINLRDRCHFLKPLVRRMQYEIDYPSNVISIKIPISLMQYHF